MGEAGIPEGKSASSFVDKMIKCEDIFFAESILEYEIPPIEEDPRIGDPEPPIRLEDSEEVKAEDYNKLWGMQQINAEDAWDKTTGDEDVIVAIIDSGVQMDHPEFEGITLLLLSMPAHMMTMLRI